MVSITWGWRFASPKRWLLQMWSWTQWASFEVLHLPQRMPTDPTCMIPLWFCVASQMPFMWNCKMYHTGFCRMKLAYSIARRWLRIAASVCGCATRFWWNHSQTNKLGLWRWLYRAPWAVGQKRSPSRCAEPRCHWWRSRRPHYMCCRGQQLIQDLYFIGAFRAGCKVTCGGWPPMLLSHVFAVCPDCAPWGWMAKSVRFWNRDHLIHFRHVFSNSLPRKKLPRIALLWLV